MRNRNDITRLLALPLAMTLPAPADAGVLPEDRADALYHRYEGGGVTVDGLSPNFLRTSSDSPSTVTPPPSYRW